MGFLGAAVDGRVEYLIVASAKGRLTINNEHWAKARIFVLEDRTVTVCVPDGREIRRQSYVVDSSTWQPASKLLTVNLADSDGSLTLDASGCGCSMGAVGNAGPSEGPYKLTKVRNPEWHTVV